MLSLVELLLFGFAIFGGCSFLTFFIPLVFQGFFLREQNLKEKYHAKWAVVTGGSSGIGRAITEKLAKQGINVVIVALDDALLHELYQKLEKQYPHLEFRAVGVDLSGNYMEAIKKATSDIDVNLLFNNAGYVTIGLFSDMTIERQMKNWEVNAGCTIRITHHFVRQMISKHLTGAVCFTSSSAGLMPSPFAVIYGSSKAFLTEFAISLAAELRGDHIDVFVMHPSPVNTNFYNAETAHKSSTLVFAGKLSCSPEKIASLFFSCVGNGGVVYEQGWWTFGTKILLKLVDSSLLAYLVAVMGKYSSEWKKLSSERNQLKRQ